MEQRLLGKTGFKIAPVVLGGNVFGWTIDEKRSFEILDAWVDAGFNAVDTADIYSAWVNGNKGGESETIIGHWLQTRPDKRDKILIFTKGGGDFGDNKRKGLAAGYIRLAVEASLKRLNIEAIDLYQSHFPDESVSDEETLGAYKDLMKEGKIKAIGASNFNAEQLAHALKISEEKGLPAYQTLQPEYNLYDRDSYDGALRELCIKKGLGVITYFSLASGFLSGKYHSKADLDKSPRGKGIEKYLTERGMHIIAALEKTAQKHNAKPAEVALAWLIARDGVTAPIASATNLQQLQSLQKAATLKLNASDIMLLDKASAPAREEATTMA
ncbi:aldo/keto reductase [Zymomonas mobilis]|uniref:Aldo/keto reductase n=1 Tax=Zymomonas mobilis subsp. pomaceae (strain ATCC 29192 / DSM 22645 / JCM 10191 / CCUG 17912 / NBRC 13757 / NCIMB 11200 / NRRL B-4491 / Barker I) TaxID=579138 RepID=F8ETI6_ZYMMT|nr:aldo/keto reductase [Zymomonas mobilis]AEI38011.1 aldo/keto reductase [Zymomonas mobilis subsp. pomaceae ATCC 29192]MDX5949379.1 aldo/keto reductase [Zymomonas mobilis subsp. pomaceae]GEB89121.1 NADP-dependent aryl-alcohol dehydrogenase [Zymomonas mobilis subsp. pomaceae]